MQVDAELRSQVRDIMADTLNIDESELPEDISQQSYSRWTSLYQMTLLMALEEHFGVTFSMNEMSAMTSLSKIVELLRQREVGSRA